MAAPQTPVWVGSQEITETPNSPKYGVDATRFYVTRIYEGPYSAISSNQPVQGQAFTDLPPAVLVVKVDVEKLPGGIGRLTVTAETSGPSQETPFAPTYEVEWVEVDKAIEEHPIYYGGDSNLSQGSGPAFGTYALTLADRTALEVWGNEDVFMLKSQFQFKIQHNTVMPPSGYTSTGTQTINNVDYDLYTLSANAQNLAAKKLRGTDSYRVWAPVVRETVQSPTLPSGDPCGAIEDPPGEADAPDGYVWQRSAQRATKTGRYGKWTMQKEWQGAEAIDTDLYGSPNT